MGNYVSQIIGKTISSVIMRERTSNDPRCQLLISFDDGSHFEFYCSREMIVPAKGLWPTDAFDGPIGDGVDVVRVGHSAKEACPLT